EHRHPRGLLLAEQLGLQHVEHVLSLHRLGSAQHLAEVAVDGLVVVDDEDAAVRDRQRLADAGGEAARALVHGVPPLRGSGRHRRKVAPRPTPSLWAVSEPPSSVAASAAPCRPKPWPDLRVVKPCVNRRGITSGSMPTPLSMTEIHTSSSTCSMRMRTSFSGADDSSQACLALRSRLTRICSTLCLSVVMRGVSRKSRCTATRWRVNAPLFIRSASSTRSTTATSSTTPQRRA